MREKIKVQFELSDYQIAQLQFLFKTLFSEFSKLIIISLFFWDRFPEFCIAVFVLLIMRTSTGGLHCHTYFGCLFLSFLYVFLCIRVLPLCYVNKLLQMITLFVCILANYYIGPVTSSIHVTISNYVIRKSKIQSFIFIFFFLVITYILPENPWITVCFWIILLNTIQLFIAKIIKKGETAYEKPDYEIN